MRVPGSRPTFPHADIHAAYLHREGPNRLQAAANLVTEIKGYKHTNPSDVIYDKLVTQLVRHVGAAVKDPALQAEDPRWTPPQRIVWRCASSQGAPLSPERKLEVIADRKVHKGVKAWARVNSGRWLVDCPMPGCSSAQMASWDDRRFFCCDCAMRAIGGKWVEVVWPDDPLSVEAQLSLRPHTSVMHWDPGETNADLAAQDAMALGKTSAPVVDPSTFPKSEVLIIEGKEVEVPVLHFGTPEWDAAQKAAS